MEFSETIYDSLVYKINNDKGSSMDIIHNTTNFVVYMSDHIFSFFKLYPRKFITFIDYLRELQCYKSAPKSPTNESLNKAVENLVEHVESLTITIGIFIKCETVLREMYKPKCVCQRSLPRQINPSTCADGELVLQKLKELTIAD